MSSPESVSSKMAILGSSSSSWRISCRFFSPPEKPSLTLRSAKTGSMDRAAMAARISLRNTRSLGASPRTAVRAVRRKFDTDTPGTSAGYCMARNRPALARASTVMASTSSPSSVTEPWVTWYLGCPAMAYASVDLPEPFGPMIAWVCPARTARSTPRRICWLSPAASVTLTCRSRISRVDIISPGLVARRARRRRRRRRSSRGRSARAWSPGARWARSCQLRLHRRGDPLVQPGCLDLADQLAEEAADDQPAGLVLRDPAGHQVEQVMILQPAAGAGVPGADDLAGEDLQVRYRVDPGPVGEHQVPVVLVGVGARRLGPDEHVADPDRVRARALQRALVGDPAAAVALGVIDEQPVLQVLAGVGEVQAAQLGLAARARVADRRGEPDHAAAQRHRGVRDPRVLADLDVVVRQVYGIVRPALQRDDSQRRPVPHDELDIVRVRRRPGVLQHHHSPGIRLDVDQEVAGCRPGRILATNLDPHGSCARYPLGNREHGRLTECVKRPRTNPVGGHAGGAEPRVAVLGKLNGDPGAGIDGDADLAGIKRRVRMQPAQPAQRGKPPLFLAAGRHAEVRRVVGPQP